MSILLNDFNIIGKSLIFNIYLDIIKISYFCNYDGRYVLSNIKLLIFYESLFLLWWWHKDYKVTGVALVYFVFLWSWIFS